MNGRIGVPQYEAGMTNAYPGPLTDEERVWLKQYWAGRGGKDKAMPKHLQRERFESPRQKFPARPNDG